MRDSRSWRRSSSNFRLAACSAASAFHVANEADIKNRLRFSFAAASASSAAACSRFLSSAASACSLLSSTSCLRCSFRRLSSAARSSASSSRACRSSRATRRSSSATRSSCRRLSSSSARWRRRSLATADSWSLCSSAALSSSCSLLLSPPWPRARCEGGSEGQRGSSRAHLAALAASAPALELNMRSCGCPEKGPAASGAS
mmetsp:Transcript_25722/g.60623  ORF Transcript_25722/g.60623 Transcript_25722/m.60623 type:complete len:202 (+) Transcript_25722:1709-2314(+)